MVQVPAVILPLFFCAAEMAEDARPVLRPSVDDLGLQAVRVAADGVQGMRGQPVQLFRTRIGRLLSLHGEEIRQLFGEIDRAFTGHARQNMAEIGIKGFAQRLIGRIFPFMDRLPQTLDDAEAADPFAAQGDDLLKGQVTGDLLRPGQAAVALALFEQQAGKFVQISLEKITGSVRGVGFLDQTGDGGVVVGEFIQQILYHAVTSGIGFSI